MASSSSSTSYANDIERHGVLQVTNEMRAYVKNPGPGHSRFLSLGASVSYLVFHSVINHYQLLFAKYRTQPAWASRPYVGRSRKSWIRRDYVHIPASPNRK